MSLASPRPHCRCVVRTRTPGSTSNDTYVPLDVPLDVPLGAGHHDRRSGAAAQRSGAAAQRPDVARRARSSTVGAGQPGWRAEVDEEYPPVRTFHRLGGDARSRRTRGAGHGTRRAEGCLHGRTDMCDLPLVVAVP